MSYTDLRVYIADYYCERISKREPVCAIALWQLGGARQ